MKHQLSPSQEKLLKLARGDAQMLISRAGQLPESRAKSIFKTNLDTAMLWLESAILETTSAKENEDGEPAQSA